MSRTDEYAVTVQPAVKATYMEVTTAPPSSVRVGEGFIFAGYLKDEDGVPLAGKLIYLYKDDVRLGVIDTDANGYWESTSIVSGPGDVGDHTFYAEFKGDANYAGCP